MAESSEYRSNTEDTRSSYNRLAEEYAAHISGELQHKPLDRALLERFAARVAGKGQVCDLGCGPGHVARYLHACGLADMIGIDLSPGMLEQARKANPGIEFREGDMRTLDLPEGSLAGIAAFYSIIHIRKAERPLVFRELRRVLKPGGVLLVAFHKGEQIVHPDEMFGVPVNLDFEFLMPGDISRGLREAGFAVEEVVERPPYSEVEHQSDRVYIFASKPATS